MEQKNALGSALQPHCLSPKTGFYRDGYCRSGTDDSGNHSVAAIMTKDFLEFSRQKGNDLVTPRPEFNFPGLKPGDRWCLCAMRWKEAFDAGLAPPIVLEATHENALKVVPLTALKEHWIQ